MLGPAARLVHSVLSLGDNISVTVSVRHLCLALPLTCLKSGDPGDLESGVEVNLRGIQFIRLREEHSGLCQIREIQHQYGASVLPAPSGRNSIRVLRWKRRGVTNRAASRRDGEL